MSTSAETPLLVVSGDEIVARLGGEAPKDAIIAFDADGTLWSGDIGIDTFEMLLAEGAIREAALPALREEAESAQLRLTRRGQRPGAHPLRSVPKGDLRRGARFRDDGLGLRRLLAGRGDGRSPPA